MPAVRDRIVQQDFSEGMTRDVAPTLISPTGVYDLVDVLLDEDGNPYRRGGTAYKLNAGLGESGLTWCWDGYLLPGARTVFANESDFGVLDSDDESPVNLGGSGLSVPKQAAVLEELLFIGGGSIYGGSRKKAPYSTGTVTVANGSKTVTGSGTTWNTLVDAGMLFQIGSERVYVVASVDSTTQITLLDAYQGASGSGKSYALSPVYTVGADPYETADYLTVCANRLVVGAGRTIKFTEINNPHTFTNGLGTTNEHTLPEGVQLVGLATVGPTVLAFTTGGVWTLDGLALDITDANGNPQHRLQQLSSAVVLAGASGLAGSEQQVVVPATDGIYLMDGVSQPVRISKPIDRLYRRRIADGYRLGKAVVYRGHYLLPIITSSGDVRQLFVCRLDRPLRSRRQTVFPWSRFTGDGGEITAYCVRTSTGSRQPVLFGAQARKPSRLVDCSAYFEPDADHESDADGSTHGFDVITRDYETGNGTRNAVRSLRPRYELVVSDGDGASIQAFYSDGTAKSTGAKFGSAVFGKAKFGGGGPSFIPIGEAGPSDGRDPARFRVNKILRYVRFRVRSSGPVASFVLRSLQIDTRPSGATRR